MKTFDFTNSRTLFTTQFFVDFGFASIRLYVSSKRNSSFSFPSDTMIHTLASKGQLMRYVSYLEFFSGLSRTEKELINFYLLRKDPNFLTEYNPKELIKVTLIW